MTTADQIKAAIAKANKSRQGKANRAKGLHAEQMVINALLQQGYECVKMETAWRVKRVGKRIVGATPMQKVLADIVGVRREDGRAVLIEVKRHEGPTLQWSILANHQRDNLSRWNASGALCFVAWVSGMRCRLIPWPCDPVAWRAGHSIEWTNGVAWQLF